MVTECFSLNKLTQHKKISIHHNDHKNLCSICRMNNQSLWSLSGQRALVTGGTKGIGEAIVRQFLDLGASVFIVARDNDLLQHQLTDYRQQGHMVEGIAKDVSQPGAASQIIEAVKQKWSGLDILVNNAGTNIRKPTADYTPDEYDFVLNTNLRSAFELSQAAYPLLKASENESGSKIVMVSSVSGLASTSSGSLYGMTKAAMLQLTRNLAVEWGHGWYTGQCRCALVHQNALSLARSDQSRKTGGHSETNTHEPCGRTRRNCLGSFLSMYACVGLCNGADDFSRRRTDGLGLLVTGHFPTSMTNNQ